MPYETIKVKEYCCSRCSYKWIARKYGIDKPKPKFCPKCKTWMWDKKYDCPAISMTEYDATTNDKLIVNSANSNRAWRRHMMRNSSPDNPKIIHEPFTY